MPGTTNDVRLSAHRRTEFGKGAARRTRRDGNVPAVLYGHGTDPVHLSLPSRDFARVLREHGTNAVMTLDVAGEEHLALVKTIVIHPTRDYVEHCDLLVIRRGEKVVIDVTVSFTGDAAPGTLVVLEVSTLQVEADVMSIPEVFEISVEGAQIGTQIFANQVELPAGVTLQSDPEQLVVNVTEARTEAELEDEVDTEGAGVVEDPSDAEIDEAREEAQSDDSGSDSSES